MKKILTSKNLWISLFPMHLFSCLAIYKIIIGTAPSWWLLALVIGYVCIMIFGITIGYHRYFSHRSFETYKIVKIFMLYFASIAGQGSVLFWVAIHRGSHHRYSDSPKDVHRPEDGFWHSYILWTLKINQSDINIKNAADLLRDPYCRFLHTHYIKMLILSHLLFALISFNFWLYFIVLPSFLSLHSYSIQTSLSHSNRYGYKNYDTKDKSKNVIWLFPFILGEAWHNNHHGEPKNSNFGGRKFWEVDPVYWLIKLIKK
jgi:stearoyl-CoA desaturase (delta-9 desaturase)